MSTSTKTLDTNAIDLRNLDEEHAEICRRYTELEKSIVGRRVLPRILDASASLVQIMLLHLEHEEQFLAQLSLANLEKRQRDANFEVIAQLFGIEAGLEQGDRRGLPVAAPWQGLDK